MPAKPQPYHFHSEWNIPATSQQIWEAMLSQPFTWDQWWPQLTNVHDVAMTPGEVGSSFGCTWLAPLGYRLECRVEVTRVSQHHETVLKVTGDLSGTATCTLSKRGALTHLSIDWRVQTMKPWMNRWAPLLRSLFTWGHHYVMMSGERGFNRFVAERLGN